MLLCCWAPSLLWIWHSPPSLPAPRLLFLLCFLFRCSIHTRALHTRQQQKLGIPRAMASLLAPAAMKECLTKLLNMLFSFSSASSSSSPSSASPSAELASLMPSMLFSSSSQLDVSCNKNAQAQLKLLYASLLLRKCDLMCSFLLSRKTVPEVIKSFPDLFALAPAAAASPASPAPAAAPSSSSSSAPAPAATPAAPQYCTRIQQSVLSSVTLPASLSATLPLSLADKSFELCFDDFVKFAPSATADTASPLFLLPVCPLTFPLVSLIALLLRLSSNRSSLPRNARSGCSCSPHCVAARMAQR